MAKSFKPAFAPYNFVSFPDRVFKAYDNEQALPVHNKIYKVKDGFYSGKIEYEIVTDSPMMIVGEKNEEEVKTFFRNPDGKYAIPGNSIRGLIRNNIMILGMCNPAEDIYDSNFLYRDWTTVDKRRKEQYKAAIGINSASKELPTSVRAGYIRNIDGKNYEIAPARLVDGKSYAYIKEDKVRKCIGTNSAVRYMYTNGNLDTPNKGFKPYYTTVHYNYSSASGISKVSLNEKLSATGILMCSNYMGSTFFKTAEDKRDAKKAHYVVFSKDQNAAKIKLSEDGVTIRSYKDDLTMKKFKKGKYPFFQLPEIGKEKPIFFAKVNGEYSIGVTPYLRILYEHSVREGIPQGLNVKAVDYSEALFGNRDYKSRLSFSDAIVQEGYKEGTVVSTVLGEPKATWYCGYVKQDNQDTLKQYNDEFALRGYKQYWLQNGLSRENRGNGNPKTMTHFIPIENARFAGSIVYNNLREDELGLLVLSIVLTKNSKQNIGLAKSLGYGKFHFENVVTSYDDYDKMFRSFDISDDAKVVMDNEELISAYENYLNDKAGIKLKETIFYKEFIHMKTKEMDRKYVGFAPPANVEEPRPIPVQYAQKRVLPNVSEYEQVVSDFCINSDNYRDRSIGGNNKNKFRK